MYAVLGVSVRVWQSMDVEPMVNDKESGSVDGVVTTIIENAKAQFVSISTGIQLALAELRVVVSHAGLLVCLVIVAAGMIIVGWGLLLLLGALLLMSFGLSAVMAVLCMFVLNIIALAGIGLFIRKTLNYLSFRHTRQALSPDDSSELGYAG